MHGHCNWTEASAWLPLKAARGAVRQSSNLRTWARTAVVSPWCYCCTPEAIWCQLCCCEWANRWKSCRSWENDASATHSRALPGITLYQAEWIELPSPITTADLEWRVQVINTALVWPVNELGYVCLLHTKANTAEVAFCHFSAVKNYL